MRELFTLLAGIFAVFGLINLLIFALGGGIAFVISGIVTLLNGFAWHLIADMYSNIEYLSSEIRELKKKEENAQA